jgi:hypothetical protein
VNLRHLFGVITQSLCTTFALDDVVKTLERLVEQFSRVDRGDVIEVDAAFATTRRAFEAGRRRCDQQRRWC